MCPFVDNIHYLSGSKDIKTTTMKYSIANHIFDVEAQMQSFANFAADEHSKADFTVLLNDVDVSNYKPIKGYDWFESRCTLLRGEDDHFAWLRVDTRTGEREWVAWQGFFPTVFHLHSSFRNHVAEHFMLIIFTYATLPHDTLILHSSVVEKDGAGYMFLGESGTGKSTHTRLWIENIEGAVMLNDDAPAVRIIDSKAVVFGSPWSGKGRVFRNTSVPINGIYRLRQAPHNKLRRLAAAESFSAIIHSAMPPLMEIEQHTDQTCEIMSKIIGATQQFSLACLPDAAAARLALAQK